MFMSSALKLLDSSPNISAAKFVKKLAQSHKVVYQPTNSDQLAANITRLAGDVVKMDVTELLLIALRRANVVDSKEMINLQVRHLKESKKKHVRSF